MNEPTTLKDVHKSSSSWFWTEWDRLSNLYVMIHDEQLPRGIIYLKFFRLNCIYILKYVGLPFTSLWWAHKFFLDSGLCTSPLVQIINWYWYIDVELTQWQQSHNQWLGQHKSCGGLVVLQKCYEAFLYHSWRCSGLPTPLLKWRAGWVALF